MPPALLNCAPDPPTDSTPMSELKQTVHTLHEELARAQQLGPEDRALLETALADIRRVLERAPAGAAGGPEGDRLESAAVRLEAEHPGLAGAIRSVLDALAKAGI
jgi:hypothetical protein